MRFGLPGNISINIMATYGYIENGTLYTKDFDGEIPSGYKPVEAFDVAQTQVDGDYVIAVTPYDAGDKIAYRYEKRFDKKKVQAKITTLKESLSESDYRIIKCYEAALQQSDMPYDVSTLCSERQALRDQINELENQLSNA